MMLRRSTIAGLLLAITLSGQPACAGSPDCLRKDIYCAGLVTDTLGVNDHGFNQDTWVGLQQTRDQGLVDHVAYIESGDSRDFGKNIAFFVQEGYDVIITTGAGLRDETLLAADFYPDTVLIGMDQPAGDPRPNLLSITFPEDQAGYWAGALAAYITGTRTVGAVCETSGLDSQWRYCEGFRAGVAYIDENIKVLIKYREEGSREKLFIDSAWGEATAVEFIRQGADVIFAAGGGTGQGALLAAAGAGVHAIGAERDQAQVLPEARPALVTSVYGQARPEVLKWIQSLRAGKTIEAVASGSIGYVPFKGLFPETGKFDLDRLLLDLSGGALKTGIPSERP
jgi:basic membrane protein A